MKSKIISNHFIEITFKNIKTTKQVAINISILKSYFINSKIEKY
jgi:hypothetical protein